MTKDEAYEKQRRERIALERENRKLKAEIDKFGSDTYVSAEKAKHLKTINQLTWKNNQLIHELKTFKSGWEHQRHLLDICNEKISKLKTQLDEAHYEIALLEKKNADFEKQISSIPEDTVTLIMDLEAQVAALTEALCREKAKASIDGTNSGIPTSQTPYDRKKVIPNTRQKSGRSRGAQLGHQKHSLGNLCDDEISDHEEHILEVCPDCGSDNLQLLYINDKDVIDYEVVIKKKRHHFWYYRCLDCGHTVHSPIPLNLKEKTQYGHNIQALALSLMNIGFVSIGRTARIINGLTSNEIRLSEGFICKLQKRASKSLKTFVEDVRLKCIHSPLIHWDDTVIFINTKRACMRFYGNQSIALYRAHMKKDRAGIDKDAVLGSLGSESIVVHDHVTMNYNSDFSFRNAECVQHLIRDLQKVADETGHSWASQTKALISETLHLRNTLASSEADSFDSDTEKRFFASLDGQLEIAESEFKSSSGRYFEDDERRLINRIKKYRENHFLWVRDFSVPPTNNLAERSLRFQKVKLKVSGQYISLESAEHFADIMTYVETCSRNGVNPISALTRLTSGNPYSISELLGEA